jgi:hypothetical protein
MGKKNAKRCKDLKIMAFYSLESHYRLSDLKKKPFLESNPGYLHHEQTYYQLPCRI